MLSDNPSIQNFWREAAEQGVTPDDPRLNIDRVAAACFEGQNFDPDKHLIKPDTPQQNCE